MNSIEILVVELLKSMRGKSPNEIARIIFGFYGKYGALEHVNVEMLEGFKSNSWNELSILLKDIARKTASDSVSRIVFENFYNYLFLTKSKRVKATVGFSHKFSGFLICRLCWRNVPTFYGLKGYKLCHVHCNKHVGSNGVQRVEYRRLFRIEKKYRKELLKKYVEIKFKLRKFFDCYSTTQQGEILRHKKLLVEDCSYLNKSISTIYDLNSLFELLPNVRLYLIGKGADLLSVDDILMKLEEPPHINEVDDVSMARLNLYKAIRKDFSLYRNELSWAEAWLSIEKECVHGGKRKGSGRPRKYNINTES